jgi:hypothetical protein
MGGIKGFAVMALAAVTLWAALIVFPLSVIGGRAADRALAMDVAALRGRAAAQSAGAAGLRADLAAAEAETAELRAGLDSLREELDVLSKKKGYAEGTMDASERNRMARVIAAEAGGEMYEGKMAVAEVILNRADLWGLTATEVMTAEGQFAGGYGGDMGAHRDIYTAIGDELAGIRVFGVPVTHFHGAGETPAWAASKTFAGQIGNHKFYY